MNARRIIYKLIIILSITIPFIVMFFITVGTSSIFNKDKDYNNPDIQWYYDDDGVSKKIDFPIDIDNKTNDECVIYAVLPQNCNNVETLFYRSLYQKVTILIDDKIIYVYDTDDIRLFGKANPKTLNIVSLPNDIGGKTIKLIIESPYHKYSGYFADLVIGSNSFVTEHIYSKYSMGYVFSLVLISLVICLIIINFLFYKVKLNSYSMMYIFISGLFVGLWLLGDSKLINLYLNPIFVYQLMHLSLMAFILVFSLYLKKISVHKYKKVFNILSNIAILNMIAQCILYITSITDYVFAGPLSLLIILCLFIMYAFNCVEIIKERKEKNKLNKPMIFEFIFVIVMIFITIFNIIIQNVTKWNINYVIGICFFLLMVSIYVKAIVYVVDHAVSSYQYRSRLKETQNYLIQSQMKPHFIFNTLGAIRTLINSSPKVAYEMTTNFSKYLRSNINNISPGEKISFTQELEHIKAYVAIEQERFKGRLKVEYDIQCVNFSIPPLSIEPLVENAVKHGVCKKVSGGTVKISSKELDDRFIVSIEDDGVGFDVNIINSDTKADSVGLRYIILRLKELSDADFEIESVIDEGTKATVIVYKNNK